MAADHIALLRKIQKLSYPPKMLFCLNSYNNLFLYIFREADALTSIGCITFRERHTPISRPWVWASRRITT